MAVTGVKLDPAVLDEIGTGIKSDADEINGLLEDITREMNSIAGAWDDENAQKYLDSFGELKKEFPAFYNRAYGLGNFLTGVVKAYNENMLNPMDNITKNL